MTYHVQIYDTGFLEGPFGSFKVNNVQIFGGYILHIGSLNSGPSSLSIGASIVCKVDKDPYIICTFYFSCGFAPSFSAF